MDGGLKHLKMALIRERMTMRLDALYSKKKQIQRNSYENRRALIHEIERNGLSDRKQQQQCTDFAVARLIGSLAGWLAKCTVGPTSSHRWTPSVSAS